MFLGRAAKDPSVFIITEKAPTRAFLWLKASTRASTFKTLLGHYAKQAPIVGAFSVIAKTDGLFAALFLSIAFLLLFDS